MPEFDAKNIIENGACECPVSFECLDCTLFLPKDSIRTSLIRGLGAQINLPVSSKTLYPLLNYVLVGEVSFDGTATDIVKIVNLAKNLDMYDFLRDIENHIKKSWNLIDCLLLAKNAQKTGLEELEQAAISGATRNIRWGAAVDRKDWKYVGKLLKDMDIEQKNTVLSNFLGCPIEGL